MKDFIKIIMTWPSRDGRWQDLPNTKSLIRCLPEDQVLSMSQIDGQDVISMTVSGWASDSFELCWQDCALIRKQYTSVQLSAIIIRTKML
jgi:hypothetical protein